MILRQSILLFIASLILHTLLSVTSSWSTELHPTIEEHSGDQSLSRLVQKFLKSDSHSQETLKEQILSHPDANLVTVTSIIKKWSRV